MQEWTVDTAGAGVRLDHWLVAHAGAPSRTRASEWLERGKVYLNGRPAARSNGAYRVFAGDVIGLWMDRPGSSRASDRTIESARHLLAIIHADADIVVVDKPVGLIVEPLPGREREEHTLVDLLLDSYRHEPRARAYVVHRIDRDTSGLVLFARTPAARDDLKEQFEQRTPERVYQAIMLGTPSPGRGTWRDKLAWDADSRRQRQAHASDVRGRDAEANYCVLEAFDQTSLIEVSLVTGKRNQIRVQAALRGHPLLGERQYRFGAPPEPPELPHLERQALHAWRLGFVHPGSGKRVSYTSPLPEDLRRAIAALRKPIRRSASAPRV